MTITLPPPLALGTTAVLSGGDPSREVSARFTVNRVWVGATPEFYPPSGTASATLSQAVHQIYPHTINLTWVGVDLAVTNTGAGEPELASPTGPGAPYLTALINGHGGDVNRTASALLADLAFVVGVPGCPFPFADLRFPAPGASASGCVALPVSAGVNVSTVGFALEFATAGAMPSSAVQWHA